jgi:lipoyl-dependent peroxiredoxin
MMSIDKVLYTAHAKATGGRDGRAVSSDGILDVKLVRPRELGGSGSPGTNPEQLFAAGYSACFIGAMKFVATRDKIDLPADLSIEASVGIGAIPNGFGIEATLKISVRICRARTQNPWCSRRTLSVRIQMQRAAISTYG